MSVPDVIFDARETLKKQIEEYVKRDAIELTRKDRQKIEEMLDKMKETRGYFEQKTAKALKEALEEEEE